MGDEQASVGDGNVEIVRDLYARFNRGDLALDCFAHDVELEQAAGIIDTAGSFHGHEGIQAAAGELFRSFSEIEWTPDGVHPFASSVAVSLLVRARGRISGAETERPIWHIWTLRDGKVSRWVVLDAAE